MTGSTSRLAASIGTDWELAGSIESLNTNRGSESQPRPAAQFDPVWRQTAGRFVLQTRKGSAVWLSGALHIVIVALMLWLSREVQYHPYPQPLPGNIVWMPSSLSDDGSLQDNRVEIKPPLPPVVVDVPVLPHDVVAPQIIQSGMAGQAAVMSSATSGSYGSDPFAGVTTELRRAPTAATDPGFSLFGSNQYSIDQDAVRDVERQLTTLVDKQSLELSVGVDAAGIVRGIKQADGSEISPEQFRVLEFLVGRRLYVVTAEVTGISWQHLELNRRCFLFICL